MANHSPFLRATRAHAAVALCLASCPSAWAQQTSTEVTITDRLPARVSGFGEAPAHALPMSTTTISNASLQDMGAQRLSDALRLDAAVSDSYNSPAYWDSLSVRGFTLDNRYNYRREGLPINAETMIPMDNKERIELLKGTSGIQAGTSSPGGLVNYVVKRAPSSAEQTIRNLSVGISQGNNRLVAADLGGRWGDTAAFGYRLNFAHEDLNPYIKDTGGSRDLIALAMDWRIQPDTVLDVEFEQSHREQIGVNGYSLLGGTLPAPVDPRVNLTRQTWSQPAVFDAMTGSVRLRQALGAGWRWRTQYGTQRLKTDDRLVFGYGCSASSNYSQYCGDGSFDLYDYRSDNERRLTEALQTELAGSYQVGSLRHDLVLGLSRQRQLDRLPATQSYNFITSASGSVYTPFSSSPQPVYDTPNTNRSEYSTEVSVKDHVQLSDTSALWLGLRHMAFNRASEQNAPPSASLGYPDNHPNSKQSTGSINIPWIGLSTRVAQVTAYASHGHGVEKFVTPNSASYGATAGTQLGIGRSRQTEVGVRSLPDLSGLTWHAALFQVARPYVHDLADPGTSLNTRYVDGTQTHRGLETGAQWQSSQWRLGAQTQWLHTQISDVQQSPETVGSVPLNVPTFVLRGMAEYRYASIPGLRTGVRVSHEGERRVTERGDVSLPAWTVFDASAHYDTRVNNVASTWTLGIDNLSDKRYWRESPKQFGHYYLYSGAPRTIRAMVQMRL